MCLLLLAWRDRPGSRLLLLGNRDEAHARASAPADWWPDAPQVLGGRDLAAGGSWLGVTRAGRFAVVTNVREPQRAAPARSRGLLVRDFLLGDAEPACFAQQLVADGARYAGCNLLCGDAGSAWYASNRAPARALAPGVYALSNATLDAPWPKVERLRARFAAARDAGEAALLGLLTDRSPAPDDALPATGLPLALERLVSSPFVASERYGTRASYLLAIDATGHAGFVERGWDARAQAQPDRRFAFEVGA